MDLLVDLKIQEYNGDKYLTVKQMASCVNRTEQAIYKLIDRGNAVRKMKSIRILRTRVLIPFSELTEFPFTKIGRGKEEPKVYYYKINEEGKVIIDEDRGGFYEE